MDIRKADKSDIQEYSYEEIHELLAESQSDIWIVAEKGKIVGMAAGTEFSFIDRSGFEVG